MIIYNFTTNFNNNKYIMYLDHLKLIKVILENNNTVDSMKFIFCSIKIEMFVYKCGYKNNLWKYLKTTNELK